MQNWDKNLKTLKELQKMIRTVEKNLDVSTIIKKQLLRNLKKAIKESNKKPPTPKKPSKPKKPKTDNSWKQTARTAKIYNPQYEELKKEFNKAKRRSQYHIKKYYQKHDYFLKNIEMQDFQKRLNQIENFPKFKNLHRQFANREDFELIVKGQINYINEVKNKYQALNNMGLEDWVKNVLFAEDGALNAKLHWLREGGVLSEKTYQKLLTNPKEFYSKKIQDMLYNRIKIKVNTAFENNPSLAKKAFSMSVLEEIFGAVFI